MISRKKRVRYKTNAYRIAQEYSIPLNIDSWEEVWDLLDFYEEPTYVYAIGEVGGKEVKLGKSLCPGQRLKQLQTGNDSKLVLWGFCKETEDFCEKSLHKLLKAFRIEGEWFLLTPEVREVVEQIKGRCPIE